MNVRVREMRSGVHELRCGRQVRGGMRLNQHGNMELTIVFHTKSGSFVHVFEVDHEANHFHSPERTVRALANGKRLVKAYAETLASAEEAKQGQPKQRKG